MVEGWLLEAICLHLEAITFGDIPSNRPLINVPPGFMKSLLVNVFWPCWEWGPCDMPHMRYISFSYSDEVTTRDNNKMVRVIQSPAYRQLWGDRFQFTKTGERRLENDQTGFKLATSCGGVSTGERGDRMQRDRRPAVSTSRGRCVAERPIATPLVRFVPLPLVSTHSARKRARDARTLWGHRGIEPHPGTGGLVLPRPRLLPGWLIARTAQTSRFLRIGRASVYWVPGQPVTIGERPHAQHASDCENPRCGAVPAPRQVRTDKPERPHSLCRAQARNIERSRPSATSFAVRLAVAVSCPAVAKVQSGRLSRLNVLFEIVQDSLPSAALRQNVLAQSQRFHVP
jgi:hypothetical protein